MSILTLERQIRKTLDPENLTSDQRIAAIEVLDNFLGEACGCHIEKAGEGKSIPFEKALLELLLTQWGKASTKAVNAVIKKLDESAGKITEVEKQQVLDEFRSQIDKNLLPGTEKDLPKLFEQSYKKAKKATVSRYNIKVKFKAVDNSAIDWLTDHHLYWISNYYDKNISDSVAKVVGDGLSQGLGRKDIGRDLKAFFANYPGVANRPDVYWRGLAANAMNRSRSFGLVQSYVDVGVKQLQILAVMDEQTSPICQKLNGKIIPVKNAVEQRDQMMAAEDPEDVKTIAPWIPFSQLQGMTTKQIIAAGVRLPPYHFHCRTTVVERF